ncbi:sodium/proton-translocating pyrophosphatase, partial [Eubacteriales bacterium DFI.9.88]|nr:sodium/proton-translocating pyrophosphatase [Eubacteriales bacterium DFI.9.88]
SIIAPIAAVIGLIVAFGLSSWISKVAEVNDRMKEISGYIREGAMAFLRREYKVMIIVIIILFILIAVCIKQITGVLYVVGELLSVLA